MKMNSDYANKMCKKLLEEEKNILHEESVSRTYSHAPSEKPTIPQYSFRDTEERLRIVRGKIAVLKHAINTFNASTTLPEYGITVDQALNQMSSMHSDKKRLAEMCQIPEVERNREYGSKEADIRHRNFNIEEVQAKYDQLCEELMQLQQAINIANLTIKFEVDI